MLPSSKFSPVTSSSGSVIDDTKWDFSSTFHVCIRYTLTAFLITALLVSIVLILVGVMKDVRQCLAAGCIIGLACVGALLHGCLSHRSLPNTPTPLVISAACMYPVTNLSLGTGVDPAAAAMATAALIPRTFAPSPTCVASSMEAALFTELQKRTSRAFLSETIDAAVTNCEETHDAQSRVKSHVSGGADKGHSSILGETTGHDPHVYINQEMETFQTSTQDSLNSGNEPVVDHSHKPHGSHMTEHTVSYPTATHLQYIPGRHHPPSAQDANSFHRIYSPPPIPTRTQRTLPHHPTFPRSFTHRSERTGGGTANKFIALLTSSSGTGDHLPDHERRYDRDREGVWGIRAWRGWHSWYDP